MLLGSLRLALRSWPRPAACQGSCGRLLQHHGRLRGCRGPACACASAVGPGLQQSSRLATCEASHERRTEGAGGRDGRVAVVAFGGNALLSRGEPLTMEAQWSNASRAAESVARLVNEEGMRLCVTHGNGPQVGLLALQDAKTGLDVLDARSEGEIGYILESQIANALPERDVVTLLTQVVVDPADPAFQHPTKQIGPVYSKEEAEQLASEKGWAIAADGDKFRRVVPSPNPESIVEARAIELLLANDVVAICCGGGGIPVAVDQQRHWRHGVEAVVDKDLASAVLAIKIRADWLLLLTDCEAVYDPQKWPGEKVPLKSPIAPRELEAYRFEQGSMAPKIEAARQFVAATGGRVGIGRLQDAVDIIRGSKGTVITAGD